MKLAALCDMDTAVGLRLAGVNNLFIPKDNPASLFQQVIQNRDIGVLFITEPIAANLGKPLREFRLHNHIPIIVELPDKKGSDAEKIDFISHIIKRAVGIDISKKG